MIKLDDAGHGLQIEFPDEINRELLSKSLDKSSIRKNPNHFIELDFFESFRKKQSHHEIPAEYPIEMQALEKACQHRTHCFVYDLVGFCQVSHCTISIDLHMIIQGILFGLILTNILSMIGFTKISFNFSSVIMFGCVK